MHVSYQQKTVQDTGTLSAHVGYLDNIWCMAPQK